jgi:beta-barrel assembly-enhancing protease
MKRLLPLLLALLSLLTACGINPVTGEREFNLVSEQKEISIGKEQYIATQQTQGGKYIIDQELTAYVNNVGQRLAAISDRPLPYDFVVVNNSAPNAWALPGGKIAVNRGLLLELENEAELAAVLGHEIIHAAARHGAKSMERGILLQGAILATGIAAGGSDYSHLAVGGASAAAGLISQKYSRDAESEADFFGMKYMSRAGYNPRAAITLQEKFVRLAENHNPSWLNGLFASHPPSRERVQANKETIRQFPPKGDLGTERYLKKIAHLKKTKEAYKTYDEGRKALQKKNYSAAETLATNALKIEPREAQFYGLQGDIYFAQKKHTKALTLYDQAIQHNNQFFQYYMQRGLAKKELGNSTGAEHDLKISLDLLPTATAYNALGEVSLAKGKRLEAKNYFKAAAVSNSASGKQAAKSFIKLDLPDNPRNYIQATAVIDQEKKLRIKVENSSSLSVKGINILARYTDEAKEIQQVPLSLSGTLQAGQRLFLPPEATAFLVRYSNTLQLQVISAKISGN